MIRLSDSMLLSIKSTRAVEVTNLTCSSAKWARRSFHASPELIWEVLQRLVIIYDLSWSVLRIYLIWVFCWHNKMILGLVTLINGVCPLMKSWLFRTVVFWFIAWYLCTSLMERAFGNKHYGYTERVSTSNCGILPTPLSIHLFWFYTNSIFLQLSNHFNMYHASEL